MWVVIINVVGWGFALILFLGFLENRRRRGESFEKHYREEQRRQR